jgi:transposase InsO family protein
MPKARLVITAVTVEKRPVSEVARAYGVARSWVYALLARYQAEGEAAFEPRSRRPKTSPSAICADAADLIIRLRKELSGQGLDAGPQTIAWHLEHHHQVKVSAATVSRYLSRAGLVTPAPAKRPKSSYIRFEADMPNECWQSDFTHHPLANGTDTEILTWLDDHSRYALSVTAHARVTGTAVLLAFRAACEQHGVPASTLTDNGMVFTTRLSGGRGGRNALEHELRRLGVKQKNGKPNHPQTQGKVERFQQTMKNWLRAQPAQPATLAELQSLLDVFARIYNTQRPHRSLPGRATPAAAYAARPKAVPGDRTADTHDRVRSDRIDATGLVTLRHNGKLHHIGIGRPHAGTRVLLLVQDLHIRVINADTGELIRELILNPDRDYQPTGKRQGWPKKTPRPLRRFAVSSMSCDITLVGAVGFEPTKPLACKASALPLSYAPVPQRGPSRYARTQSAYRFAVTRP